MPARLLMADSVPQLENSLQNLGTGWGGEQTWVPPCTSVEMQAMVAEQAYVQRARPAQPQVHPRSFSLVSHGPVEVV